MKGNERVILLNFLCQ